MKILWIAVVAWVCLFPFCQAGYGGLGEPQLHQVSEDEHKDIFPYLSPADHGVEFEYAHNQIKQQQEEQEQQEEKMAKTSSSSSTTATYEVYPSNQRVSNTEAVIAHHRIERTDSYGKLTFGDLFILSNPVGHFTVIEPLGGCGANRQRVSDTMRAAGCQVASNAGFFNTHTGACLGNLVSNGRVVQAPGYTNAGFGLDKHGNLLTGYLPPGLVANGTFQQLVTGVMWLVRDGENYVDSSALAENMTAQETGSNFITVISARAAIGHNALGQVMLLVINGKTNLRGVDLYTMAQLMMEYGALNAINLDGGGSATLVQTGGIVINYPSDSCRDDPRFSCERAVTSAICFI